jgi:hypothetical protein
MAHVVEMFELVVVGKAHDRHFGEKTIKEWVAKYWSDQLNSPPTVKIMEKGWILFKFSSGEDVVWLLKSYGSMYLMSMLLKNWNPLFDPSSNQMDVALLWVRLPPLLLELWTPEGFHIIGNAIGTFMEADMSFLSGDEMTMARILVMVDMRGGLVEEMTLKIGENIVIQKLDYEGIPF